MAQVIQFANHLPSDQIKTVHIIPENQVPMWSECSHNTRKKPNRVTIWTDQNCSQIKSPSGLTKTVHIPEKDLAR